MSASASRRAAVGLAAAACAAGILAGPAAAAFPGPDGSIAFERGGQILVRDPGDLNGGTPLAGGMTGADSDPVWSPDGLRIAFISDRAGSPAVWTI